MRKLSLMASESALAVLLVCGPMSAATLTGNLSQYRTFRFGMDLPTIVKQIDASLSQAKAIHSRPALIQELEWRPQSLGPSSQKEAVNEVTFSFFNGELYRIAISYDRYEIEGMTADDMIEGVSAVYGPATRFAIAATSPEERYGDQDEVAARWQDSQYTFELMRASYGPTFKLIGVQKKLDTQAQAAIQEAKRLDLQEAPERDAARQAGQQEIVRAKLEKSRLVNKPRFRP